MSPNCLETHGWRFVTVRSAAMNTEQCEALSAMLQLGPLMSLPEMVFQGNAMELQHVASGLELRFEAEPALKAWARDHLSGACVEFLDRIVEECSFIHASRVFVTSERHGLATPLTSRFGTHPRLCCC